MPAPILKLLAAAPVAGRPSTRSCSPGSSATRDEAAFAELVRRHGPLVYRVCSRLVGPTWPTTRSRRCSSSSRAARTGCESRDRSGSWLIGVAGRVARQMRARESPSEAGELARCRRTIPLTPDAHLLARNWPRSLDDELTRLPDDLRDAIVLCLLQGRTQDEAAAETRRERPHAAPPARPRKGAPAVAAGTPRGRARGRGRVGERRNGGAQAVSSRVDPRDRRRSRRIPRRRRALRPPAVVAKGVVASMVTTKHWLAVACVAILGLGLVGGVSADRHLSLSVPSAGSGLVSHADGIRCRSHLELGVGAVSTELPPASHRSANFVVHAPTPMLRGWSRPRPSTSANRSRSSGLARHCPTGRTRAVVVTSGWSDGVRFDRADVRRRENRPPLAASR